jgi:hypothetical protein
MTIFPFNIRDSAISIRKRCPTRDTLRSVVSSSSKRTDPPFLWFDPCQGSRVRHKNLAIANLDQPRARKPASSFGHK